MLNQLQRRFATMSHPDIQAHRHCMVVHNYYPLGEPRVQRQAEALVQSGATVDVICLRRQDEPAIDITNGVQIYRLPVRRNKKRGFTGQFLEYLVFFFIAAIKITTLHVRRRYQVVQVHNLPDFLVFAALIPRLMGARIILDLHDLMPEFLMARGGMRENSLPVRMLRLQEQISCRFAHHVITVTEGWRQTLVERGVDPSKCSVVMNVPDEKIFSQRSAPISTNHAVHAIYHGNLTQRYGIDLVLRALARARTQVPDLHLTIHGRGDFLPEIEQLIAELDLQKAVTLSVELVPMEQLFELLTTADIGLVPYRRDPFTEGILPTKLMEYAALGLPVIAARTPAIEAYFSEDMVSFFEADDLDTLTHQLIYLSQHPDRRVELAHNIQQFGKRYNWTTQRAEYLSLVAKLARS
jgi:glycosyltransferase involved in cell wall biosynthesis